jgi:hypothetical protein
MTNDQHTNMRPQGGSIGGLLVIGALTASHRLRRWTGLAALWMLGFGFPLLILAVVSGTQEIVGFALAAVGIGAVISLFWLIATFLAWIVRIVAEDTRESTTMSREND